VLITFAKLDINKTNLITYTQFLFATLPHDVLADDTLLERHFNDLDSLTEGFLTKQSIAIALKRKGFEISEETVLQELQTYEDFPADGKITLELFKGMLSWFCGE